MIQKTQTVSLAVALLLGYVHATMECSMNGSSFHCIDSLADSQTQLGRGSRPHTYHDEYYVQPNGWGNWGGWYWAPSSEWLACGVDNKVEPGQGGGDDSASNAIDLKWCNINNWHDQKWSGYDGGYWGDWNTKICDEGMYVTGLEQQYEDGCGSCDDTAGNKVRFRCQNLFRNRKSQMYTLGSTGWGGWKQSQWDEAKSDSTNTFICGIKTKVEGKQGGGDDTALNGIQVAACTLPPNLNIKIIPQTPLDCTENGTPKTVKKTNEAVQRCHSTSGGCSRTVNVCNTVTEQNSMTKSNTLMRSSTESWSNSKSISSTLSVSATFSQGSEHFVKSTQTIGLSVTGSMNFEKSGSQTSSDSQSTGTSFTRTVSKQECSEFTLNPGYGECKKAVLDTSTTNMKASCVMKNWFMVTSGNGYLSGNELVQAFRSAGYQDSYTTGTDSSGNSYIEFLITSQHDMSFLSTSTGHVEDC